MTDGLTGKQLLHILNDHLHLPPSTSTTIYNYNKIRPPNHLLKKYLFPYSIPTYSILQIVASILDKLLRIKQHVTGSAVTREITKSAKRTRSGKHDAFSARGVRNAQQYGGGGNGWRNNNNMDTGSGYYDDASPQGRYDEHYDDEDLYYGSGSSSTSESGSGVYEEYGSGGGGGGGEGRGGMYERNYPAPNQGNSRSYHETGSSQPKATKNPTQTSHTYNVYPVHDNGGAATGSGDVLLTIIGVVCVRLILSTGILPL